MKTRILGMAIGLGALWTWSPGCTQPAPECTVGTASAAPYIAKFIPQGDDCAEIPGDYVGMQVYNPATTEGTEPDMSIKQVALQTATAGVYLDETSFELAEGSGKAYSLGTFDNLEPDGSNICSVTELSPAHILMDEIPGETGMPPVQDALDIEYRWSNLKLYVTPANLGNQAEADLTFVDGLNDCTANYHVVMLWPAVGCEEQQYFRSIAPLPLTDETRCDPCDPDPSECEVGCSAADDTETCKKDGTCCEAHGTCKPFEALCDQEPDPQAPYEIPQGSGISPSLDVTCDPVLLTCVLRGNAIQRVDD